MQEGKKGISITFELELKFYIAKFFPVKVSGFVYNPLVFQTSKG